MNFIVLLFKFLQALELSDINAYRVVINLSTGSCCLYYLCTYKSLTKHLKKDSERLSLYQVHIIMGIIKSRHILVIACVYAIYASLKS